MAVDFDEQHFSSLQDAFRRGNLTFYLGAGVSKPNGLPCWEEFVQALYFSTLDDESYIRSLRPYPNYLFALAEWVLKQKNEPLDIIIRKIKLWYEGKDFVNKMKDILYAGISDLGYDVRELSSQILDQNSTLGAVLGCCKKSVPGSKGLHSIITYNYDNLLELVLEGYGPRDNFQVVYRHDQQLLPSKIPIYHVHGYIPYKDQERNVSYDDIIFSEDQYNHAFQDQSFWGNLVQVNRLTSGTGLMIGISLSDRNTRRILDSTRNQPLRHDNFILMQKPQLKMIDDSGPEIVQIRQKAQEYLRKFPEARMKMRSEPEQIQQLLTNIYRYENNEFKKGFESLGLHLITYDEHSEIPSILDQIAAG